MVKILGRNCRHKQISVLCKKKHFSLTEQSVANSFDNILICLNCSTFTSELEKCAKEPERLGGIFIRLVSISLCITVIIKIP